MQFGFMKSKGTTDAIFIVRQMRDNFSCSILALSVWEKLLIGSKRSDKMGNA